MVQSLIHCFTIIIGWPWKMDNVGLNSGNCILVTSGNISVKKRPCGSISFTCARRCYIFRSGLRSGRSPPLATSSSLTASSTLHRPRSCRLPPSCWLSLLWPLPLPCSPLFGCGFFCCCSCCGLSGSYSWCSQCSCGCCGGQWFPSNSKS